MSIAKQYDYEKKKVTTLRLKEMKKSGVKIVCLTAYDALTARVFSESGVDVLLVGDSLGNVFQGLETTLSVTLEQTIYHTKAVVNGAERSLIVADMPFMTYQVAANEAFTNAGKIMKETGCNAVKLEGGSDVVIEAISKMTSAGIPVMGHLGLTPQSINQFGSYRARGKDTDEAEKIFKDAHLLQEAGAFSIVLEKIPAELGRKISESLTIPTIGIGAGAHCDGQILVWTDMLGLTVDFNPRFVRRYAELYNLMLNSTKKYGDDIRKGEFPNDKESY
ncbi:MAG: 3-methyl-2-oxobutanoate hydroxymethyltransferase [Candidatus Kapabacteria bacterium]|nr:3-methyl-2-oxobutanoate hydroxymethyltransferase [Ignavibacteriota bacterium]MCW5883533.1 3-methyl-2-oxobutanoate hydroxymethyltransferase [Candidatus Kapabacteria bacterium]